jgi:biopolymer transport protein ExbB
MIDYIMKGGVIMIPIVLCSVLALGIILERLWRLRWKRSLRYDLLNRIEELLREQKTPEATTLCKRHPSIMTRMLTVSELLNNHQYFPLARTLRNRGRTAKSLRSDGSGGRRDQRWDSFGRAP